MEVKRGNLCAEQGQIGGETRKIRYGVVSPVITSG